jgi:hypothetical protein
MGEIYLTEQDAPRREVALKLLTPELSEDASRERFARESEAAASIDHGRGRGGDWVTRHRRAAFLRSRWGEGAHIDPPTPEARRPRESSHRVDL